MRTPQNIIHDAKLFDDSRLYLVNLPMEDYDLHNRAIHCLGDRIDDLKREYYQRTGEHLTIDMIRNS